MPQDVTALRLDVKTAVGVLFAALTVAGLYYGLTAKIEEHTREVARLNEQLADVEREQREVARAVVELIATLRAVEVIK